MASTQTIGELLVKLLFQTNADQVLGGTGKAAAEADQNLRQLIDTSDSFTISMKGGEPVIEVQNKKIQDQARVTDNATKSWRSYLAEQRLQSRLARETMGAVTSIAYAMSFLDSTQTGTSESSKALSQAMLTGVVAMNGAEFSMVALGKAAEKLPGQFGAIGMGLSRIAGPAGITIGILAALTDYMARANAEGRKAEAEGIGKFIDRITSFSGKDLSLLQAAAETIRKVQAVAATPAGVTQMPFASGPLRALLSFTESIRKSPIGPGLTEEEQKYNAILDKIKDTIRERQVWMDLENEANKVIQDNGNEIQNINLELEQINEKLKSGITKDIAGNSLIERRVVLQRQLDKLLLTQEEMARRRTEELAHQVELEKATVEQLKEQMKIELSKSKDPARRRDLERGLFELGEQEKKMEEQRLAARQSAEERERERQREAINVLGDLELQQRVEAAKEGRARALETEEQRHQKVLADIEAAEAITLQHDDAKARRDAENAANLRNINAINFAEQMKQTELLGNALTQAGQALADAIGGAAGDFFSKMIGAMRIALQIAQTVTLMNAGKMALDVGTLGIVGQILGVLGLFDEGGWTGHGQRQEVAGLVHRDEVVFEQPLVATGRNREFLLGLRAAMKRGPGLGAPSASSFGSMDVARSMASFAGDFGGRSASAEEMRVLRRDMVEAVDRVSATLKAGLDIDLKNMKASLRQEYRDLNTYLAKKVR